MHKQILNHPLQTISWLNDQIVDWSRAGESYSLTGHHRQIHKYHFGFNFDASIHSDDGKYVFIFQRLGTKGLLIKNGEILREINRSYYQADVYEYPAVFITYKDKVYLGHCPKKYCQLDFEDVETGDIVTNIETRNPADIFHSRLEVSKNGKYLMSKGWIWHPVDVIQLFKIDDCFSNPNVLDKLDHSFPDVGSEICTASFIDDNKILIGSSDEVIDKENIFNLPANSFVVWNFINNTFSNRHTPTFEFGNLFAIDENFAWDIYRFPKIINLTTGEIVDKAEDIYSGEQKSSILWDIEKQLQIAFDYNRKRLAVKDKDKVIILTRE